MLKNQIPESLLIFTLQRRNTNIFAFDDEAHTDQMASGIADCGP